MAMWKIGYEGKYSTSHKEPPRCKGGKLIFFATEEEVW